MQWTNRNFVDDTLTGEVCETIYCMNGENKDHTESARLWYTDKLQVQFFVKTSVKLRRTRCEGRLSTI